MELTIWVPLTVLLGLGTFALLFAFVSACDKVHNAGSILTDLRAEGDQVWERFTVPDPHEQLWYYSSVTSILQRRLPGPLTEELARMVQEIGAHVE